MTRLGIANTKPMLARFAAVEDSLPGTGLEWLRELRHRAADDFARHGFPGRRVEAWRYTNLNKLAAADFAPKSEPGEVDDGALAEYLVAGDGPRLVFVDGRINTALSRLDASREGVRVEYLSSILATEPDLARALLEAMHEELSGRQDQALAQLNTAFMSDGAVIVVDDGVEFDRPIEIFHFTTGAGGGCASHIRNIVVAGAGSRFSLIENFAGSENARYWTNNVTQIVLGRGAELRHYRLQSEAPGAFHTSRTDLRLAAHSSFHATALSTGGSLARHETRARLLGAGASCALDGVNLAGAGRHLDTTVAIDHAEPGGESRQNIRNVIAARGRALFQGLITVRPQAQKTNARQTNRNLLLAKSAEAITKPELEIWADDVKCAHGATVGELDQDMLFYLRSRGLDDGAARGLLVSGFITEILETIESGAVRSRFDAVVAAWLPASQAMTEAA